MEDPINILTEVLLNVLRIIAICLFFIAAIPHTHVIPLSVLSIKKSYWINTANASNGLIICPYTHIIIECLKYYSHILIFILFIISFLTKNTIRTSPNDVSAPKFLVTIMCSQCFPISLKLYIELFTIMCILLILKI